MVLGRFAYDTLRMHKARQSVCEKLHWTSVHLRKSQVSLFPFLCSQLDA